MEDTLRGVEKYTLISNCRVLILVLMEDTLRVGTETMPNTFMGCLNPCFNGRYSQRFKM